MSDVLQMYPRATPDKPRSPRRETFAVGRQTKDETEVVELARICAWCGKAQSHEDKMRQARGAKVTHVLCTRCRLLHFSPDGGDAA